MNIFIHVRQFINLEIVFLKVNIKINQYFFVSFCFVFLFLGKVIFSFSFPAIVL